MEGEGIGLACLPPSAGRRKRKAEKGGEKERFISFAFFWELSLKHSGLLLKKKKKGTEVHIPRIFLLLF